MSPEKIITFLRYQRQKDLFQAYRLDQAIEDFFISQGYVLEDSDLQDAADAFRESNGLFTIEDFEEWISQIDGYTLDDFEQMLKQQLYREHLILHHFEKDSLIKFFEKNKWRYAQWDLSVIKVIDPGIAEEIYALLRDEGYDFAEMASRFSLDFSTSRIRGRLGPVFGRSLEPALANALLKAGLSGNHLLLHPNPDKYYEVYKIEEYVSPVFDQIVASFVQTDFLENHFFPSRHFS